jgi:protein required for attachment to host cells
MQLPKGATVAVADGEKLNLFRNTGDEGMTTLTALPHVAIDADHKGSDTGHRNSSANPDDHQAEEDGFSVGVADFLNKQVLDGVISALFVIAAPRTLGELRKHFHKKLSAILVGELSKDLAGRSLQEVETAIAAA